MGAPPVLGVYSTSPSRANVMGTSLRYGVCPRMQIIIANAKSNFMIIIIFYRVTITNLILVLNAEFEAVSSLL